MNFIIYQHPESDSIGIVSRAEWNQGDLVMQGCENLKETFTMPEAIICAKMISGKNGLAFMIGNFITPDILNLVADFHRLFDHPILDEPAIPAKARAEMRYTLLKEELQEFRDALDKHDLVGIADAFADIQYVLAGAVLEFGMGDYFSRLFLEVQRSNMSKACATEHEADLTIEHYSSAYDCYKKKRGDQWFVYRLSDNKTLKSIGYSPADIKGIL